jgi:hypothetical protein
MWVEFVVNQLMTEGNGGEYADEDASTTRS